MMGGKGYDYDWLVIGSGFGGSVSALRLAQKGYSVAPREYRVWPGETPWPHSGRFLP
jgi:choline dehydrogenase-like flavoprotein